MHRRISAVATSVIGLACLGSAALATTYSGPGGIVPDARSLEGPPGIVESDLLVADATAIQTLTVTLEGFSHTWCGDIVITLTHVESGLTRTLVSRIGLPTVPPPNSFGDSSNYGGDYAFADPFTTNIWTVAASGGSQFVIPAGGYFATAPGTGIPVPILDVFAGANAAGTWRLNVSDHAAGDTGQFSGWSLEITGDEFDPCPSVGDCCAPHAGPGCDQGPCCDAVCTVDPSCCETAWDRDCAAAALGLPDCICIVPPICGDAGTGDCCTAHAGPLCDNGPCCNAVCAVDPPCCDTQWDVDCVALALTVPGCGCVVPPMCGDAGTGDCCAEHAGPLCENAPCCDAVCAIDPSCCVTTWDADCVAVAQTVPGCGCVVPPMCGDAGTGDCCAEHAGPLCENGPCCDAVCAIDPSCCVTTWDADCVAAALAAPACGCVVPPVCGDAGTGDCCTAHAGPLCDNGPCCDAVCAIDPSCCDTAWDEDCVAAALGVAACGCFVPPACGDAETGDCCTAHAGPLCDNGPCCVAVCAIDPSCCDTAWDADCVAAALGVAACGCFVPPACGDAETGDCCTAHAGPLCDNAPCCEQVCALDPACCAAAWDSDCVTAAQGIAACGCPPPPPVCPGLACCFTAAATKGCNGVVCCQLVCASDPFCCDVAWDFGCVLGAYAICCPGDFNGNGAVDGADLGELLSSIGQIKPDADFNCDGIVNGSDLGIFLSNWGPCGG